MDKQTPRSPRPPKPWKSADKKTLKRIKAVCFDIDETFSTQGKITADAFSALWALKRAGFILIPITGRPSGWCDHIVRFWPVDAVVGENGAFVFFMKDGRRARIDTPLGMNEDERRAQMIVLRDALGERFPEMQVASDQAYREYDIAVDICEDVKAWTPERVNELVTFCQSRGAHAKVSSVHVNIWVGDFDKCRGIKNWLEQGAPGLKTRRIPKWDEMIFIGDSPNDEPNFAAYDWSVGVANLKKYLPKLKTPPTWLTQAKSGDGFCEMAKKLLASR